MLSKTIYIIGKSLYFKAFIFSALLSLITFSDFTPIFTIGIDDSISWAYNFLFNKDVYLLKNLVFPHGPLAFLLYPLPIGNNLIISFFVVGVLKVLLSMNIFILYKDKGASILGSVIISYLLMSLLNIQLVIIGIILTCILNYLKTNKNYWPFIAIVFCSLALFIKTFCGIVSLLLIISLVGYIFLDRRDYKYPLILMLSLFLSYLLLWLILFGTINGFSAFFKGIYELSLDNSSAASIYPSNNWVYLGLSFLSIIIIPFIHKNRIVYTYYVILALAVFATWKYSFSREDITHARTLFYFLVLVFALLFSIIKKHEFLTIILVMFSLGFYYLNLDNVHNYNELSIKAMGLNNFKQVISGHEGHKNYYNSCSEKNIISNRIGDKVRQKIGNKTIDIYPWEYTYIPINNFNWKPRRVLQSYASYTSWLDLKNAKHFASKSAPDFILWELNKMTKDLNGGDMESIDQRYLLNDEPQALNSILANYKYSEKDEKVILLERRDHALSFNEKILNTKKVLFDQWTNVPMLKDGFLKAKLKITNNYKGKLISSLYKDQAFYIYYKLENNVVLKYRFVPKNALDGIWVNPFIYSCNTNINESSVSQIKIEADDLSRINNNIEIEWLHYNYENSDSNNEILSFFGKEAKPKCQHILSSIFNKKDDKLWSKNTDSLLANDYYTEPNSYMIEKINYPLSFQVSIDSLIKGNEIKEMQIESHLWLKTIKNNRSKLVISISDDLGIKYYKDIKISDYIAENNKWEFVNIFKQIPEEILKYKTAVLKVYIWNLDKEIEMKIDDFEVNISGL